MIKSVTHRSDPIHRRASLAYRKGKPTSMRRAIDHGVKALAIYEYVPAETKFDKTVYMGVLKLRYNLADLYSQDVYNCYDDAKNLLEAWQDDLGEDDDESG